MKLILITIAANIPTIAAIAIAGTMAINGRDGWGWFLFVAALLSTGYESK